MSGGSTQFDSKLADADRMVTSVAGDGTSECRDGTGSTAQLSEPFGISKSSDGESLLIVESEAHRIRRFFPTDGTFSAHESG